MPKRHERREKVEHARRQMMSAIADISEGKGLTLAEEAEILAYCLRENARAAIQQERHPNDPDASPDEAED